MNECKAMKERMADALAGEAGDRDLARLQAHLDHCRACATEYSELKAVIHQVRHRPQPECDDAYWDKYMQRLDARLDQMDETKAQDRSSSRTTPCGAVHFRLQRLWPLAAAALVLIGVLIGRFTLRPGAPAVIEPRVQEQAIAARSSDRDPQLLWAHLSRIEPLLLDLSHHTEAGSPWQVSDTIVRELLLQNYMLKRMLARQNDPVRTALLDDLEMILLEMSSVSESQTAAPDAIQSMIIDNGVLFRLRLMHRPSATL